MASRLSLPLLLALVLATVPTLSHARATHAAPRPLRVALDNAYAPYSFQADGHPQGLLVDQWRAWERATGIPVRIEALNWNEALRRMRAGEFDVIDSIVATPERRREFAFTPPYSAIEASIFFREDISGIADLGSLKGFPVGVKAGDQHIERLLEAGVTTIVPFRNNGDLIAAAKARKIGVFVMDNPSALNLLTKAGIEREFHHSPAVFRDELRRAVHLGETARLREVTRGFAAIDPAELSRIDERWLGKPIEDRGPYLRYGIYGAALALLVIAILSLWNYGLRRGILQRTAALGESELRLRQITDNIRDVFWIASPGFDEILYVSPAYESVWGRPVDYKQGAPLRFEEIHPDDRARVIAELQAHGESGFDLEYRIVRPDDAVRWVRNRGFPVKDASGRLYRITGIAQDLTAQKAAEDAARETASQLELLSRRLVLLQELERNALARELHDRVGQNLTALNINLSILRSGLPPQADDQLRARLEDSEVLLEATTAAIRNVVTELRPPMLDDQGLALALDWYASEVSARTGVLVQVRGPGPAERPPPQMEIALFRIAQEALNNVIKHACATRVEINFTRTGEEYWMTVEDDGIGFPAKGGRPTRHAGLGIVTMRERSQAVGGSFEVRALPGSGTLLTVRVPAT